MSYVTKLLAHVSRRQRGAGEGKHQVGLAEVLAAH